MPSAHQPICETCGTWLLDSTVEAHIDANQTHIVGERARWVPGGEADDDITGGSTAPPQESNAALKDTDVTGPQGADGADGVTGPQGDQGANGGQGPAGADGATGPAGTDGIIGVDGVTGPQGPQGEQGVTGPAGAAGGGSTLKSWDPAANKTPTTNPATFVVRNGRLLLAFDDTTDESAIFTGVMPQEYAGGGIDVIIRYAMDTATSGDVDLDAAFERVTDGGQDLDADGFATAQSTLGTTVPGSAGVTDTVTISFTDGAQIDSIAVGDDFRIRIRSLNAGTATGDLQLVSVEIREA